MRLSRVDRLAGAGDEGLLRLARFHHANKVALLARQAVELPDDYAPDLLASERVEETFELGPMDGGLEGAHVYVFELFGDLPALALGEGPAVVELTGGGGLLAILVFGDAGVDYDAGRLVAMFDIILLRVCVVAVLCG